MELYIYSPAIELRGVIDVYSSLRWRRRFFEPGEFELHAPASAENIAMLAENNIIHRVDRKEAGIIEGVTIAAAVPNYTCDTSGTVEIARGKAYQAEIICKDAPKVAAGTPDEVTILPRSSGGGKWYYYFVPIGKPGDCVGIYINGGPKQFMVRVK